MKYTQKKLVILLLLHHAVSFQDSIIQKYGIIKDRAPNTRQYYSPLASYTVRSRLQCAKECSQLPCCVSLFVTQTNAQLHCALYDIVFADTFLKEDSKNTRYMYKTPVQGMSYTKPYIFHSYHDFWKQHIPGFIFTSNQNV